MWLAGLWPDAAAPPHEIFAAAAACVVMQTGLLVGKPRRRLGQTLVRAVIKFAYHFVHGKRLSFQLRLMSQGTVVLVASSVFNAIFVLAGIATALDMWCDSHDLLSLVVLSQV